MRSPARILFVLFTLLLTVQGEPVLGARTKVIVRPAAGRSVPEEAYGICLPVRLSCDGVAVCGYDAQLPTGERVAALSADELAARGVPRLDDVVRQWRGRDLRLFLELCPSAAEPLSEEERAERELILRRADAATCGAFAAADASCGCCALAETALQTAYGAGFRQGDVWLIADDAEVFARYGGRSSKVPLRLVAGRDGQGRCAGAVSAPDARRIEIRRETVAQRRPADRGLGCQFGRGCRRDAGLWRRFHRDRRSGIDWRSMTFCPTAPPFRPSFCRVEVFAVCGSDGKRRKERFVRDSRRLHGFYWGIKKLQQNALQLFSVFRRNQRMSCFLSILTICGRITSRIRP